MLQSSETTFAQVDMYAQNYHRWQRMVPNLLRTEKTFLFYLTKADHSVMKQSTQEKSYIYAVQLIDSDERYKPSSKENIQVIKHWLL